MKKYLSILLTAVLLLSIFAPSMVQAVQNNTTLDYTNVENWLVNSTNTQNVGNNTGATAFNPTNGNPAISLDSTTFAERGTTVKFNSEKFRASLPLNTKKNTDYRLTFSYYTDALTTNNLGGKSVTYAFESVGIFIPNHPAFAGISGTRIGLAYTMSYLVNYGFNYQMNTPAGQNWTVNQAGAKTGFADQDGDGVADGDKRTYKYDVENFHNIETGKWYTLSFEFSTREFEDITFTFQKMGGNMWMDDIVLENLSDNDDDHNDTPAFDPSAYFENPDNWVLSLVGSQTNRRNISTDGTDGTYFSGEKGSAYHGATASVSKTEGGKSIKLIWATHASNIALPSLEKGKAYRLKFSYKVVTDANTPSNGRQMNTIGIYSPKAMNDAIANGDAKTKFNDRTVGWNVSDYFNVNSKGRYRDETLQNCAQDSNRYAFTEGDYSYAAANTWYDEELYFTATDYNDLYLVIIPGNDNKGGVFLDEFEFEQVDAVPDNLKPSKPTPDPEPKPDPDPKPNTPDNYFETASNWSASVHNSSSFPSKNILLDGVSDTTVATAITWASFKNDFNVNSTGSGSALLINNPNHAAHIKLPNIETGATYRLKFAYKPTGGAANASVINFMGIFDPVFTQNKIKNDDKLTYSNLKTGFIAVDAYKFMPSIARYRFENGVYEEKCAYATLGDNSYNEKTWRYSEFYFTAKEGLDNLYLIISYTTEAKMLYVDGFEFEKVDAIPENQKPGAVTESNAPKLDEDGKRVIDMEQENIITGDAQFVKRLTTGGYGNNGATLYLPAQDHTVTANPTKVTALNWTAICSNRTEPYFRTAVEPNTKYSVTIRVKANTKVETNSRLLLYGDWYGYYDYKNAGVNHSIKYSDLTVGEWTEYTCIFTTKELQNEIVFFFNAGEKYPELYIDEVEIEKVPPRYNGPQESLVFDFEDNKSNYAHALSNAIKLETTKGVDGKQTTALHVPEKDEETKNVTFLSFNTTTVMADPVFTFPVEENSLYSVSMWIKRDKTEKNYTGYDLWLFYDYRGTHATSLYKQIKMSDFPGTEWEEIVCEFYTVAGQKTATFTLNADTRNIGFWLDNITYTKVPAGIRDGTENSYCENPYNLISKQKIKLNDTIIKKTVTELEIPAYDTVTFGMNVSGNGKLTLSWDKEGKEVLGSYDVSKLKGRVGFRIITGTYQKLYATFEPVTSGIKYSDFYLFKSFSLAGRAKDMGYAENINNRKPVSFENVPTVSGNSYDDVVAQNNTQNNVIDGSDTSTSPSTGDTGIPVMIIVFTFVCSAALLLLGKRKNAVNH